MTSRMQKTSVMAFGYCVHQPLAYTAYSSAISK